MTEQRPAMSADWSSVLEYQTGPASGTYLQHAPAHNDLAERHVRQAVGVMMAAVHLDCNILAINLQQPRGTHTTTSSATTVRNCSCQQSRP